MITQLVDKSAGADLRATKMLFDMIKDVEQKAGVAPPPPEPARSTAEDKEVVQLFVARLHRQILQEIAEGKMDIPRTLGRQSQGRSNPLQNVTRTPP